ncbi:hypothetical protein ACZ90_11055 [Streptomyces albus subsp. albus]|nr:hypothetical protein ACZ90_11055 [Streptomyces albus subsp. albus]
MSHDEALIGHWSSAPFDYGIMESSDLGFLPDGRGWSVVANLAGMHVTRFRWHCPAPGVLEVSEEWHAQGGWAEDGSLASVEESGPRRYLIRTGYRLRTEQRLVGEASAVPAVRFEEDLACTTLYARGAREIQADQDPAHRILPRD